MNKLLILFLTLLFIALPSSALADNEVVAVDLTVTPKGNLFKEAFRPIDWRVRTTVSTDEVGILPMKKATLNLGSSMTFKPNNAKTPVCPDNKIGPIAGVGYPIPLLVAQCPLSIIGNGTAEFKLGRNNTEAATRTGIILIFNGGYVSGKPKMKIMAFSYDTGAGIYVEGILTNGKIEFNIPVLTADSAVTSLNLNIPGENEDIYLEAQEKNVFLPGGLDQSYAQARCPGDSLLLGAVFDLGTRNTAGQSTSETLVRETSDSESCVGLDGAPSLKHSVSGPGKAKIRKKTTYSVTVSNTGTGSSSKTSVKVSGKGVSASKAVPAIRPDGKVTVKVPLVFKKKGKIKVKFVVAGKSVLKTVKVA